jgi:hypothetical protein
LTDAGLRRVRFHDLRHSFASLLLQNGERLTYVKEQMGHSSINVTVDIYGHLVPGGNRQAVDRLDDIESGADKKTALKKKLETKTEITRENRRFMDVSYSIYL